MFHKTKVGIDMNRDFIDEEWKLLIRYFKYNVFRKLLASLIWIIGIYASVCLLILETIVGLKGPSVLAQILIIASFFTLPISRELKSYRYIRKKDFKTYTGIFTKKDFDILPKSRGYEVSYYVDIQDNINGIDFKNIKIPRYVYKKILTGGTCEIIIINPSNDKSIYVCPISYLTKNML